MKISVITWDADFREKLHTIDSFANQDFDEGEYEFIWVDFYGSNAAVRNKINEYDNCRLLTLNHSPDEDWHLGVCINKGVRESVGEIIIVPDGDVLVEKNFISKVFEAHKNCPNLLSYYRRYDEPEKPDVQLDVINVDSVEPRVKLLNPLNYAGCFSLDRSLFLSVNGYENHNVFSGPGMNAYEFYIRARNSGVSVRWCEDKIYHPWHESTGLSGVQLRDRVLLVELKKYYPWLNPYSGVEQSWVTHCREMNLDVAADSSKVDGYLSVMPEINTSNVKTNDELLKENEDLAKKKSSLLNDVKVLKRRVLEEETMLKKITSIWFVKMYLKISAFKWM